MKLGFKKVEGTNVLLYEGHLSFRNGISAILFDKGGPDQYLSIDLTVSPDESQGLSEAEKPHLIAIFQDYEGIIWVRNEHEKEFHELEDYEDCIPQIYEYLMSNF